MKGHAIVDPKGAHVGVIRQSVPMNEPSVDSPELRLKRNLRKVSDD